MLIITEDWCGDAMMNIPILKHTIEFLNIKARVFHRDDDTHLIDQYLTNGKSRAIPIFVFMNDSFEQLTVWRPRAKEVGISEGNRDEVGHAERLYGFVKQKVVLAFF